MRMKIFYFALTGVFLLLGACSGGSGATDGGDGGDGGWQPAQVYVDVAFTQEIGQVVGELSDVRALALDQNGTPFLATASGVVKLTGDDWTPVTTQVQGEISDLAFDNSGKLAVAGPQGVAIDNQIITLPAGAVVGFVAARTAGGWWLAGDNMAGYFDGTFHSIWDQISLPVAAVCDLADGSWLAATSQGIVSATGVVTTADGLPSNEVRALSLGPDGTLWAGTDSGMARRDPVSGAWSAFLGADGLHYGDVLDVDFDAAGDMLVSTSMGAGLYRTDGTRRYYFGRNWIPADRVNGMARDAAGTIWLATDGGVSRVLQQQTTLAEKASLFDEITHQRHVRLGYTSTENSLQVYGDTSSYSNHDDDNDGQWTAMYLASQCFRYSVTGEAEARENAHVAAYALMKLEQVTPIKGFFARSIVPADECDAKQQGEGEWHLSDDGQWCWKGDTSSDEFVGHMFGLSLFYDLVADEQEKQDAADTLGAIVGYIVDNGYRLLDIDGEPTTHGHFDPDWMENDLGARFGDAGLDSAMILGGLLAAYHMTGDEKFRASFDYLAHERNYKNYIACIEEINTSFHINHDSEEMSFLAMYTLLRYVDDPELLDLWKVGSLELECGGLRYLWEVQRPERNPEFNMIYAALSHAEDYDLDDSIETLQKLPRSLILWGLDLFHRWDKDRAPYDDRFGDPQNEFVFPYDERQVMRWAGNPYAYGQRGSGYSESSGTFWLLPYWMGRYLGVIR